ncbi:hypothetical protein CLV33_104112 [Jejuia pallidilutea]|uniref:N-acetyltransferase domain-containing protein n=1 Tax=Jejuia pallidilutea TaxID=504487 RepID=A0A362X337_9FLAO|nr:GNAT family N-acetyltransferase [Jejuia pallidilutea]PQV48907.1 hypothetical protein CLV33_104112 [Jejuia pallidilutea]
MEVGNKSRFYRLKWFWNIIRHGLFFQGLRNRLAKIGIDIMPYYWTLEGSETIVPPKVKGDTSGFTISHFNENDIEKAQRLIAGSYYKDLVSYFKEGQICVGIKDYDAIVAFMFVKRDSYLFRGKTFNLAKNEAYMHSMYTFELYRGRRIAPYLRYHCYGLCKEMGLSKLYSISEYFNKSSKKFKQKLKAKQTALYISINLFNSFKKTFLLKKYKV